MKKRLIQSIVILVVILLVGAVFIIKRTGTGSVGEMQEAINANAHALQDSRAPLEIEGFTAEMIQNNDKPLVIVMGES